MTPQSAAYRRLHEAGCFVMPNPWDIGSARILVSLGFRAVATTSAGFAWSVGRRDTEISLEVDKNLFQIPNDYKKITYAEMIQYLTKQ